MSKKLKLFKKDILIKPKAINEVEQGIIHLVIEDEGKEKANYFEVLQVAEAVTEVKPGDIVMIPFGEHTDPFMWEGERVAISDETKLIAVIEP